jgi:hypothetical protein
MTLSVGSVQELALPEASSAAGPEAAAAPKVALIMGLNYYNSRNALRGCVNDAINLARYLVDRGGYQHFVFGLERRGDLPPDLAARALRVFVPTRANIAAEMARFARQCNRVVAEWGQCEAFLHYSGHGGSVAASAANAAQETDGRSETWIPLDFGAAGQILDVEVNTIMCKPLNPSVNLTMLTDCCHSATSTNLAWKWDPAIDQCRRETGGADVDVTANIVQITGCMDNQTSADASIRGTAQGACTAAFLQSMAAFARRRTVATVGAFGDALHASMIRGGYTQRPQISSSRTLSANTPLPFQSGSMAAAAVPPNAQRTSRGSISRADTPTFVLPDGVHWMLC